LKRNKSFSSISLTVNNSFLLSPLYFLSIRTWIEESWMHMVSWSNYASFFSSSIYVLFIADRYYYMPRRRITKIHSIHWHAYYWVRVPAGLRPWVYFGFNMHEYMSDDETTTNERLMTISRVILILMCKRFFFFYDNIIEKLFNQQLTI